MQAAMDIDDPPLVSVPVDPHGQIKRAFKDWVRTHVCKPREWHAQDWLNKNFPGHTLPENALNPLINEAIDESFAAVQERERAYSSLKVPGFGLPLGHMPPADERFPVLIGIDGWDWKALTLLIREVCMFKVIEELTNKPDWWVKVHDPEISEKWKQEALQMDWTGCRPNADFTPEMAEACINELRKKATLYEQTGLIPIFDYSSCVIKSDSLIPTGLRSALREAVGMLENVPEKDKDWHPGTTKKVLDLVHPSMWPFVYGRSRVLVDKRIGVSEALKYCGTGTVSPTPQPIEVGYPGDEYHGNLEHTVPSLSNKFQWLPCDVALDGANAKIDSYVNNLHPVDHASLYPVIERFIEKALPAWDIIYRWPKEFETQRITTKGAYMTCTVKDICRGEWNCHPWNRPLDDDEPPRDDDENYGVGYRESERGKRDWEWLVATHPIDPPNAKPDGDHVRLSPSDVKSESFFNGASRVQVIVKLANIHLTPEDPEFTYEVSQELVDFWDAKYTKEEDEKSELSSFQPLESSEGSPSVSNASTPGRPLSLTQSDYRSVIVGNDPTEYEGGSWHTEGMLNERICATALFYYDSENITDCQLDFRTASNREELSTGLDYSQHNHYPIERILAIPNVYRDTLQDLGGVRTTNSPSTGEGDTRAVFFPNLLQHRVSPFRLADPTRPGHRKILALFLVDPAVPVISTANVPPQQRHWWYRESQVQQGLSRILSPELTQMVLGDVDQFPIYEEDAKQIRLELMEERSNEQDKTESGLRVVGWNFCEH